MIDGERTVVTEVSAPCEAHAILQGQAAVLTQQSQRALVRLAELETRKTEAPAFVKPGQRTPEGMQIQAPTPMTA